MSVYMTEEEQLESFKKWWRNNGTIVTVILSVLLFCVAGYRYMSWHQEKIVQESSVIYENMMIAFSNQNNKEVRAFANKLIKDYGNQVYADVAHMTLAKLYVSKQKLNEAKQELSFVSKNSKMTALRQIAKIRIARLLAAQKSYDSALDELATVEDKTYLPVVNELKGDIYGATGKYDEAFNFYRLAIDEIKTNGMGNLFLEMKKNELATQSQSMNAEKIKTQPV